MMRRTKFLLALVLVTLALSSFAKAQNVPVKVSYAAYGQHIGGFSAVLINNNTNDYYFLETSTRGWDGDFRLGSVPPGNYTVFMTLIGWGAEYDFNWWAKDQSGTKLRLQSWTDALITDHIDINDDYANNDAGLYITFEDW